MKLDFVIIGGQKCGSTYLQTVINEHPEIDMISGECAHFESPDFEKGGLNNLGNLIENLDTTKIIGIKRPSYLFKEEVPLRIKDINEKTKIIAILRNPLERFKSDYFHNMNYGFFPSISLNEGVEKLLNGELHEKYPRTDELIEFGFYAKYLKNYIDLFGENILILTYDELKKDKLSVIKKCYSFLGVDSAFVPDDFFLESHPQQVNYSLFRAKLLVKKNKFQFIYNENKTRLFAKEQSFWDKFICHNIDRIDNYIVNKFVDNKKPMFSKHIKNKLLKIYLPDIENLERLLNRDLSYWKSLEV